MKGDLLAADHVHSIVGGFLAVYNYFGYGMSERVYAQAMACELRDRGHVVIQEQSFAVSYKGRHVAMQRLDMLVDDTIIVENKATEKLCPADRMQLLNYLRTSRYEVGLLLHFGPQPRFERYVDYPKKAASLRDSDLSRIPWTPWLPSAKELGFVVDRGAVAQAGVATLPVVPHFNKLEYLPARLRASPKGTIAQQLFRQGREETLDDCIVPTVADTTHARCAAGACEELLIGAARVLYAAVGVMHHAACATVEQRHVQRAQGKLVRDPSSERPADDPTRREVQEHGEIEPAFAGRDIRDIRRPRLVDRMVCDVELAGEQVCHHRLRVRGVGGYPE